MGCDGELPKLSLIPQHLIASAVVIFQVYSFISNSSEV